MGYIPKSKHLKPDAVPTIFADSKPKKRRELSEKRIEKKNRQEIISQLLGETDGDETREEEEFTLEVPTGIPQIPIGIPPASTDDQRISHKKKSENKRKKDKKQKRAEEEPLCKTKEIGIQVSADTCDIGISCDIQTDHSTMIECSNCYAREHPNIVMSDHIYSNKSRKKVT